MAVEQGVDHVGGCMKRFLAILSILAVLSWPVLAGAATKTAPETPAYRLAAEDVLRIAVWKEEDLQVEAIVRPDGRLTFPLVGEVTARGKTVEQVRSEIARRLSRYIPDPVVSVSLIKIGGNKVFVIGEANKPGAYVLGEYLDVMQALSLAGGLTPYADRDGIRILRRVDGREEAIAFDYDAIVKGRRLEQNIRLRNGDVIVIP